MTLRGGSQRHLSDQRAAPRDVPSARRSRATAARERRREPLARRREELGAAPAPVFDCADSNGDGYVDRAELAALKAKRSQAY
ncbi:hypothetical protein KNJ79_11055 [Sphingopyxis indica]|uniref:EF-hand domain-containing protein n=1 Tax=Sphingopyxis indica TaxID=436663 RepID=UPI0029393B3B|nr:EF-hand domain-containing protein [Sphingopyxis indica]WOF41797.1 hypothetical protein KNJ79_11055 [Sphingopyxis indica]